MLLTMRSAYRWYYARYAASIWSFMSSVSTSERSPRRLSREYRGYALACRR
jgi:hypothetical protein